MMSSSPHPVGKGPSPAPQPSAFSLSLHDVPPLLAAGVNEIVSLYPERFSHAAGSEQIRFEPLGAAGLSLRVERTAPGCITIGYGDASAAFRALGLVMGQLHSGRAVEPIEQRRAFASVGAMVDLSRNAVMRPEALRTHIRFLALMGINRLLLYLEDTYELPEQPIFGYFRGGYTQEELKQIDDYAALFGMDVVPCIQTLGHLEQVLQWPGYAEFRDTAGVLLVGDERTDAWVEQMIRAASAPFRSRRIHIGMDEAHGIGSGIYRLKNGVRPPFEILRGHLERTAEACARLGLEPMIWSDMFFRLGSRTNNYYDLDSHIASEVAERIPANVELVYWDYYHTDPAFYDDWINRHRQMGKEPVLASGIWTWNRFWAQLPHSLDVASAGMLSARAKGLKEVFTTAWGDDGTECDMFSALPAILWFAQQAYADSVAAPTDALAREQAAIHFAGACGGSFEAWVQAGELDQLPVAEPFFEANPSKWLFWHDPLLGFLDRQITDTFVEHYVALALRLEQQAATATDKEDARLAFPRVLAAALALKADMHRQLRTRYAAGDSAYLRQLLEQTLPELKRHVATLQQLHERSWLATFRVFGWEVLERRYAGLLSRLETLECRLSAHLADPQTRIDELECESHEVWPQEQTMERTLTYRQTVTPSFIG